MWSKNDIPLNKTKKVTIHYSYRYHKSYLIIKNVTESDTGTYKCYGKYLKSMLSFSASSTLYIGGMYIFLSNFIPNVFYNPYY